MFFASIRKYISQGELNSLVVFPRHFVKYNLEQMYIENRYINNEKETNICET